MSWLAVALEVARLVGQDVVVHGDRLEIRDIAGEGAPVVGRIERRGDELWLAGEESSVRLRGPLAHPRIAGPGHEVWVVGTREGDVLVARRLGVLRTPR